MFQQERRTLQPFLKGSIKAMSAISAVSKNGGLDQDKHKIKIEFKYKVGILFREYAHPLLIVRLEWPQLILSL